jgi:chloramphenicol O-acetyltransferase type A
MESLCRALAGWRPFYTKRQMRQDIVSLDKYHGLMKEIFFTDAHRKKHFDFFLGFEQPHFNICAPVNITEFKKWQKANGHPFNVSVVYFLARAAHAIKEFRWRIRGSQVFEHKDISPSFTVPTDGSDVFSFCTVPFNPVFDEFVASAQSMQAEMAKNPSFEDEPGRDDYFFMSSLPWIGFTGVSHAMGTPKTDSVPRMTWGKVSQNGGQVTMPLSIQAHHAVVDGSHTGQLFQALERAFAKPDEFVNGSF